MIIVMITVVMIVMVQNGGQYMDLKLFCIPIQICLIFCMSAPLYMYMYLSAGAPLYTLHLSISQASAAQTRLSGTETVMG